MTSATMQEALAKLPPAVPAFTPPRVVPVTPPRPDTIETDIADAIRRPPAPLPPAASAYAPRPNTPVFDPVMEQQKGIIAMPYPHLRSWAMLLADAAEARKQNAAEPAFQKFMELLYTVAKDYHEEGPLANLQKKILEMSYHNLRRWAVSLAEKAGEAGTQTFQDFVELLFGVAIGYVEAPAKETGG